MTQKYTKESFINKAVSIHGDKYDYSLVNYKNLKTKIMIKCKIHGQFEQIPTQHIYAKNGCSICSGWRKTADFYLKEVTKKYGSLYDYSKIVYTTNREKIEVICPKDNHGSFYPTADNFLHGSGCPRCTGRYKTTEKFIEEAKLLHGEKYDYSLVKYINSSTKIDIICKKHGIFKMTPNTHLAKQGCAKCKSCHSAASIRWLEYIEKKENIWIQHANNFGELQIKFDKGVYKADGFCYSTNTWYEYMGDIYHCNPKIYKENDTNYLGKIAKNIWLRDERKKNFILKLGLNYVSIWENEWLKLEKEIKQNNLSEKWEKDKNLLFEYCNLNKKVPTKNTVFNNINIGK